MEGTRGLHQLENPWDSTVACTEMWNFLNLSARPDNQKEPRDVQSPRQVVHSENVLRHGPRGAHHGCAQAAAEDGTDAFWKALEHTTSTKECYQCREPNLETSKHRTVTRAFFFNGKFL